MRATEILAVWTAPRPRIVIIRDMQGAALLARRKPLSSLTVTLMPNGVKTGRFTAPIGMTLLATANKREDVIFHV
jgi:hypothetical protein